MAHARTRLKVSVGLADPAKLMARREVRMAANRSRGCTNCKGKGYIGETNSQLCGDCYGMNEDTHADNRS